MAFVRRSLTWSLFTGDKEKEQKYFASIDPDDFNAWLKSGIPVAKVTSTGLFGPYDPTAADGRPAQGRRFP